MSKEKYKQIIDEVYKNYTQNTPKSHVAGLDSDPMKLSMDWKGKNDYSSGYPILERLSKESFINKIKTYAKFSKKWGLKIKERVLSLEERMNEFLKLGISPSEFRKGGNYGTVIPKERTLEVFDTNKIPTKLITIKYQNETIITYE